MTEQVAAAMMTTREPYYAEGVSVYFRSAPDPTWIADALSAPWARHLATAMNHWQKPERPTGHPA